MRSIKLALTLFGMSLISFIISLRIFWNGAIYIEEYGLSLDVMYGGKFWIIMDLFRLILLFILTIITGLLMVKAFEKRRNEQGEDID